MMARLLVLNGPNLNLQGVRESGLCGTATLRDSGTEVRPLARSPRCEVRSRQFSGERGVS